MKHILKWLAKITATVVTVALLIVFFPYISQIAKELMPDESASAVSVSVLLEAKLMNSSRLETLRVEESNVLDHEVKAAFIGTVVKIHANYTYAGSFGIDLQQVVVRLDGDEVVCVLPQPELIQDHLTADASYTDDFWYPGFTKEDYQQVLENERIKCRERYLSGEQKTALLEHSLVAFEETIAAWSAETGTHWNVRCEWAQAGN